MLLSLDFSSDIPIYIQIRNQIVLGIARGELQPGERLPSLRTLSDEAGVNMMTVNKAYQLLKQDGYISIDRRSGTRVNHTGMAHTQISTELETELRLALSKAHLKGIEKTEILRLCANILEEMEDTK